MSHGFELELRTAHVNLQVNSVSEHRGPLLPKPYLITNLVSSDIFFMDLKRTVFSGVDTANAISDFYGVQLFRIESRGDLPDIQIKIDHFVDNDEGFLIPEIVVDAKNIEFYNSDLFNVVLTELGLIISLFRSSRYTRLTAISSDEFLALYNMEIRRKITDPYKLRYLEKKYQTLFGSSGNVLGKLNFSFYFETTNRKFESSVYPQITFSSACSAWYNNHEAIKELYGIDITRSSIKKESLLFTNARMNLNIRDVVGDANIYGMFTIWRFYILVFFLGEDFEQSPKNMFHIFPKTSILDIFLYYFTHDYSEYNLSLFPYFIRNIFTEAEKRTVISKERIDTFLRSKGKNSDTFFENLKLYRINAFTLDLFHIGALHLLCKKFLQDEPGYSAKYRNFSKFIDHISYYCEENLIFTGNISNFLTLISEQVEYFIYKTRIPMDSTLGKGEAKFEVRRLRPLYSSGHLKRLLIKYSSIIAKFDLTALPSPTELSQRILSRLEPKKKISAEIGTLREFLQTRRLLKTTTSGSIIYAQSIELKDIYEHFLTKIILILSDFIGYFCTTELEKEVFEREMPSLESAIQNAIESGNIFRSHDILRIIEAQGRQKISQEPGKMDHNFKIIQDKIKLAFENLPELANDIELACNDFEILLLKVTSKIPEEILDYKEYLVRKRIPQEKFRELFALLTEQMERIIYDKINITFTDIQALDYSFMIPVFKDNVRLVINEIKETGVFRRESISTILKKRLQLRGPKINALKEYEIITSILNNIAILCETFERRLVKAAEAESGYSTWEEPPHKISLPRDPGAISPVPLPKRAPPPPPRKEGKVYLSYMPSTTPKPPVETLPVSQPLTVASAVEVRTSAQVLPTSAQVLPPTPPPFDRTPWSDYESRFVYNEYFKPDEKRTPMRIDDSQFTSIFGFKEALGRFWFLHLASTIKPLGWLPLEIEDAIKKGREGQYKPNFEKRGDEFSQF